MKKILASLLLLNASAFAAHFDQGRIIMHLIGKDSITVAFEGDAEDMMNTVRVFPYYFEKADSVYRLYENRLEAYLQQRLVVKVDGRRIFLRVAAWKPDGKGRSDRFDSVSIRSEYHMIVLGAALPRPLSDLKTLEVRSEVWSERTEANPMIEYSLAQNRLLLRQHWARPEVNVRFPIAPDSLAAMRAKPPAPLRLRKADPHAGHNH